MKPHSFFVRLFLGNLVIVVVAVVGAALVSYRAVNEQHLRVANAYQDNLCLLAVQHVEDVWPLAPEAVDRLCKDFLHGQAGWSDAAPTVERGVPARLTVIAPDGAVLGDSHSDPARMENHRTDDRPEVLAALDGRPASDVRRSETLAVEYRYVARPIRRDGRVVGVARVATPVLAILESQAVLRDGILWGSVLAVAAFALIGLLINWTWYAPLRRITQTAREIASGDLTQRAAVSGAAELAQLGRALNAMRDSLAAQIATITAQRERLQEVVASLREGVIALDADGRVALMNAAATRMLAHGADRTVGEPLRAVVRVAEIVDAYHRAATTGEAVRSQVETQVQGDRRHLDVLVSPLAGEGGRRGTLIVVRDVTDIVRTAAIKAEFVANASHELRTPLATLRAALESLDPDEPPDREALGRTLAILHRHLDRLENLTLDLLNLHAIESAKRNGTVEAVRHGALADWVRGHFAEAAAEKGVALQVEVPAPDDVVRTDRRLLELILQNLVDNAVKFTPAGGRVTCTVRPDDGRALVRIADTGCGIPREDQGRVFERFYQTDAARSGDARARGTGLGLAIVKHAAERLGATVSLESEPGRGTTVSVRVPDRGQG